MSKGVWMVVKRMIARAVRVRPRSIVYQIKKAPMVTKISKKR